MAASLTPEQQTTYNAIEEIGLSSIQARHAALRFGSRTEEAINWVFENPELSQTEYQQPPPTTTLNDNDEPPPLISIDDDDQDLPHPSTIGRVPPPPPPASPRQSQSQDLPPLYSNEPPLSTTTTTKLDKTPSLLPAHYIPSTKPDIDLTRDENYPFYPYSRQTQKLLTSNSGFVSKEDQDLQRAIQESTSLNTTTGSQVQGGGNEGEDDLDKALKLSMASLGSQEGEGAPELSNVGMLESIPALERLRDSLETPVLLRSNSPLMSSLSCYLQCLYAIKSWRNCLLGWRKPKGEQVEGEGMLVDFGQNENEEEDGEGEEGEGFNGYWKGDQPYELGGIGRGNQEELERVNRIRAVQRLFSVMHDSRRKFVHVKEVVKAFGMRESEFHYQSGVPRILDFHQQLLTDLIAMSNDQGVEKKFLVKGRKVLVDEWIGNPLPPIELKDTVSSHVLGLEINPSSSPAQSFFERLDNLLLNVGERLHSSSEEFHLLTSPHPSTLLFSFNRQTELTSLDNFASSSSANSSNSSGVGAGGRKVFKVEKEIWLDRYYVRKRKEIKENWDALKSMRKEFEQVREKERKLKVYDKDGRDAVGIVKGAVEYLEGTREVEEGEEVSVERRERQERLRESYAKILKVIEQKLEDYESNLSRLESTMGGLYDSPTWRTLGPYHLTSILIRNGLNGRGSVWSIVKGDDGRWFRTNDLTIEEISIDELDKVLSEDKTGLFLDAGVTLAFYQLEGAEEIETQVPSGLSRAIARDNHTFSGELLSSVPSLETHEIINSWNLPPLSSLPLPPPPQHSTHSISLPRRSSSSENQEEAIPITIDSTTLDEDQDDIETVQNITLTPPPPTAPSTEALEDTTRMSVDPEKVERDEDGEEELEPLIPGGGGGEGGEDEEMLSQPQEESTRENEESLRLRGGAHSDSEEEEEEEEDEEDYPDEDEVELGLLEPMPAKDEDEWDIDYKVGKVGGKPVWLDPRAPLDASQVSCQVCDQTMSLLLQVNSPDDTRPHAAARTLYVFACRSKGCVTKDPKKALKVWRTQMESPNEFFPHTEESINKRKELESELDEKTQLKGTVVGTPKPWMEWDIAAEPEPYEESYLPDPSAPTPEQDTEGDDANADDTVSGVDKEFLAFQERIEREPRQVLRFYRLPDIEAPEPLWTSSKTIQSSQVPPCELCRGPREIEFQVLSTLLSHLKDETLEFDSLLVYTCLDHCEIPPQPPLGDKTGWKEEVVYKQDFTSSGVRFGLAN